MRITLLIIALAAFSNSALSQNCKPWKKKKDDFLGTTIQYFGGKLGTERSLVFKGASVTSYFMITKEEDGSFTAGFQIGTYQKTNDAKVNIVNYANGCKFLLKTPNGVKQYVSTGAQNIKSLISEKTLTTSFLTIKIGKEDVEYFMNNPIMSYRVIQLSGNMMQGTVKENLALKIQNQMACILEKPSIINDESIIKSNSEEGDGPNNQNSTVRKRVKTSDYTKNRYKFQIGRTYLNNVNLFSNSTGINRLQIEYSYLKKFDKLLGLEWAFGLTHSSNKFENFTSTEETFNRFRYNYIYIMPKLNFDIVNKPKFTLFANAGAGAGLSINSFKLLTESNSDQAERDFGVRFLYDINAGINYFVNDSFGITASVGFPTSLFKIGLTKQLSRK